MRIFLLLFFLITSLFSDELDDSIRSQITNENAKVKSIYSANSNRSLWVGHEQNIKELQEALQDPYFNYKYKDFYQSQISNYTHLLNSIDTNSTQESEDLAKLDILLTKSYLDLINFIVVSDIDWAKFESKLSTLKVDKDITANWELVKKTPPSPHTAFNALKDYKLKDFLTSLTPQQERHKELVESLKFYQSLKDVKKVPYAKDLKLGDSHKFVVNLKERLAVEGDIEKRDGYSEKYDDELQNAVISYKKRFHLEQNTSVDKIMIYYLNKPTNLLTQSLVTNLDKLKVFPNKFSKEYLLVNLPAFELDYMKDGTSLMNMWVVVGRGERPTPIFSESISYIELNPTWTIPDNLVRRDLIPTLKTEPDYLQTHNIKAYRYLSSSKVQEITNFNVEMLAPYEAGIGYIPFKFVQGAGETNALGKIKFMFPNKYSVYLHDTDSKELLDRRYRVYSSGCVRLQKPFDLLYALKGYLSVGEQNNIDKYIENGKTVSMSFKRKLPVNIVYFTVFNKEGKINFRKDIYDYDKFIQESQKEAE